MSKHLRILLSVLLASLLLVGVVVGCVRKPAPVGGDFGAQAVGLRPLSPYLTHLYTEVTTDTWYVLVDLSDTTNYPHIHTNSIILKSLHYAGDMASATHWDWNVGVVTAIATNTTNIEWVTGGVRTKAAQFDERWQLPEHGLNLLVSGGVLPFVGTIVSDTTMITSGTVLSGSAYITTTLAVGDLILYLDEELGNVEFHFTCDTAYDTE